MRRRHKRPQLRPDVLERLSVQHDSSQLTPNADGNFRGVSSYFEDGFLDLAFKFCLLGASDEQLGYLFQVSTETICNWLKYRPGFAKSVMQGRQIADANVSHSLYRRALGCSIPAVKMFYDRDRGEVVRETYMEHYPPDASAGIFWLKARQPDKWNPKPEPSLPALPPPDDAETISQQRYPVLVIRPIEPAKPVFSGVTIEEPAET